MFTSLTIAAAWFAFGYAVTDILMASTRNRHNRKNDE
jgi:hypothetical protein